MQGKLPEAMGGGESREDRFLFASEMRLAKASGEEFFRRHARRDEDAASLADFFSIDVDVLQ